jgi:hypothetical protein
MNQYVENSELIHYSFHTKIIKLTSTNSNQTILKILEIIFKIPKNLYKILYCLLTLKPDIVYFSISPVNAFLRDLIYVVIIKIFNVKIVYHLHGKGIKRRLNRVGYIIYSIDLRIEIAM